MTVALSLLPRRAANSGGEDKGEGQEKICQLLFRRSLAGAAAPAQAVRADRGPIRQRRERFSSTSDLSQPGVHRHATVLRNGYTP